MKFTKTKTETIEVEITFPHYRKTVCHTYKVLNEKNAICVTNLTEWHAIGMTPAPLAWNCESTECDESYYTQQFNEVLTHLTK